MPFSLIGLTLAIFLGFRNGTSYARYWEARTLWGTVLNDTRTLVRQALTLSEAASEAPLLASRLIAFVHALRHRLRKTEPGADFRRVLSPEDCERLGSARYKPAMLLLMAGEWLRDRRQNQQLAPALIQAMA